MPAPTTLSTLEPGSDLADALQRLAARGEGWIHATGRVEAVELRVEGESTEQIRALRGRFTLLQLAGPAGGPFSVTLARASDAGIEVLGGLLARARVTEVSAAVHHAVVPEEPRTAVAPRAPEPPRVAELRAPFDPRQTPPFSKAVGENTSNAWGRVAAASAAARARAALEDNGEDVVPEVGDLAEHFAFGLCEVIAVDGDRLRIRDINGPRRIREVALGVLKVSGPVDSSGKKLFTLARRGT